MLRTRLLSRSEIEGIAERPDQCQSYGALLLCTIMEPIELTDHAKKGRWHLDQVRFLAVWRTLVLEGAVIVAGLDANCLIRSLFDRSEDDLVIGLWSGAVAEGLTSDELLGRIVRRLILRPSEQNWWEPDLFGEMENWYGDPYSEG